MYVPKKFRPTEVSEIAAVIGRVELATLVSIDAEGRPLASHLPLQLDAHDERLLIGHFARANGQWRTIDPEGDVLAVFLGPHAYVSPTWYDHVNTPTWDYASVHVHGRARLVQAGDELRRLVEQQVRRHERPGESPYTVEGLPDDFRDKELRGIVGFEIRIERVEAAFKLSQDKSAQVYDRVIEELDRRPDASGRELAEWMRRRGRS